MKRLTKKFSIKSHILAPLLVALSTIYVAGCVTTIPEAKQNQFKIGGIELLTRSAEDQMLIIQTPDNVEKICMAATPDAVPTFQEGVSVSISSQKIGDSEGVGAGILGGRGPVLLLARELLFRTCEFSLNYRLNKSESLDLYKRTLQHIEAISTKQGSRGAGSTPLSATVGDTEKNGDEKDQSDK
ncbi:hypothetical protein ACFL17_06455 [Pseudomonadota bacterium]